MTVHLIGASSSPGCANFGFGQLAKDHATKYPNASDYILSNFYMDHGLKSVSCVKDALQMIGEATEPCTLGNLQLHRFVSNSREVMEGVPISERQGVWYIRPPPAGST